MGNDAFRWYNVGDWADKGLAVPNFGNDTHSQNDNIRYLTDVMGRAVQTVMFHHDAHSRTPPTINTLMRIHKLCHRARTILASRMIPANTLSMETAHALPSPEEFKLYPTPYFKVRNPWLKQYCGLLLLALTEAMQHTENARPIEISEFLAGLVGQYIHRVYRMMSVELFLVPLADAEKLDFMLTDEHFKSYNPAAFHTSSEMIDTVPNIHDWPTEDNLEVLTNGIPASQLLGLPRWPNMLVGADSGVPGSAGTATTTGVSFAPAPSA